MIGAKKKMKRIAVAGEIYSANVGDRAIHGCMLYLLKMLDPTVETISIDISGRLANAGTKHRMGLKQRIALLKAVPGFQLPLLLLNIVYQQGKILSGQSSRWRRMLETADALVIGGGQLLMDDGLNFPLKLSGLTRQAQSLDLPYHISACGVGESWSKWGRILLRKMLQSAYSITLRDQLSQNRLSYFVPDLASQVTADPAIWAAEVYPVELLSRTNDCIGIGIINLREANSHFPRGKQFSKSAWTDQWLGLIEVLISDNQRIELFTTGNPADHAFAVKLLDIARERGWNQVSLAPYPNTSLMLMTSLGSYSMVAAARLHAAILSNAYGISSVGLVWDQKVKAYYAETDRLDLCFDLTQLDPDEIAQACIALRGQPFPDAKIDTLKMRSLENARVILELG